MTTSFSPAAYDRRLLPNKTANIIKTKRHHRATFLGDWSNHYEDVANLWILKMAAVRHLGFSKLQLQNFNSLRDIERGAKGITVKILWRSVKPSPRNFAIFRFQDGDCPPSWILTADGS